MNKMRCKNMSVLCSLKWMLLLTVSFVEANQPTGLKIQCTEAGFFARPGSCKQYYRCVDWFKDKTRFSIYHFTCPAGTVFDDAMDVCSNPNEVQSPVMCMGDEAEPLPTDPEPEDYDSNTDTENYIDEENESNPEPDSQPEPAGVTFPPLPPGEKLSCTEEGFFPYPGACSSFYRCVDLYGNGKEFNLYLFHCGPGTVFHPGYDICNHPAAVPPPCGNAITEGEGPPTDLTPPSRSTQTTRAPTPTKPVTVSSTSGEQQTEPSLRCTKAGFFGYPSSCKIFYRCVDLYGDESKFNIYFFKCPTGTVFNEGNSTCDFPYNVPPPCGSMVPGEPHTPVTVATVTSEPSETTQPSSQHSSSATPTEQSSSSSTKEPYQPPPRVPFDCKSAGFFPYPDSCTKYIQCVDYYGTGKKYATFFYSCAPGTVFDSVRSLCDHKYNVEPPCGTGSPPTITESTFSTEETTVLRRTTPLSGKENTDSTVLETTVKTTPSDTTTVATTTSLPTTDLTSSSIDPPTDPPVCTEPGFFAYAESCKIFYRCVNMTEDWKSFNIYFFQCPKGTGFDNDLETCNHIAQVPDCKDTTDPDVPSLTTTYSPDTTTNQGNQTSATHDASSTVTTTSDDITTVTIPAITTDSATTTFEPKDPVSCTEPGYFPYPGSCTKFYRCVNETRDANKWAVYYFQCSNDTVFDPATSICNYRQEVNGMLECEMTTVTGSTATVTSGTDVPNPVCKEAGFFLLPESCTKFYRCVDWFGDGSEFSIFFFDCPSDTVFDDTIDTCVPPHRMDSSHPCGGGYTFPTDSTTIDTSTGTGTEISVSPSPLKKPTYVRVTGQCHKYHVVLECDQGLVFQESTQTCLPPDDADLCETSTSTILPTDTTPLIATTYKLYTVVEESLYACPAPGFYPYEADCIRFYRCVEQEPGTLRGLLYRCPAGYQYSDETKFCAKEEDTPECTKDAEGLEHRVPIQSVLHATVIEVDQLRDFFNPKNLRPYIYEK